jgi:Ser/Thr protein kinase RdoA (MazF antagonist)
MPGVADFRDAPSEERMRDAMQLLARVHLAAEQYRPRTEGQAWFSRNPAGQSPAVAERSGVIADWTSDRISVTHRLLAREPHEELRRLMTALLDLYQARSRAVRSELHEMSELRFSLHPCLRDIWHDHVLFAGEQVTGLIDLAATRTENVAADLSRLLGSLLGDDDARWERALLAYQEVRTLTHAEHQLVGSLDRSSVLLSGMTWIDRRLTGCLRDEEIPHVLPRLESILNRLDRLRV